jgi:hypothetical protein
VGISISWSKRNRKGNTKVKRKSMLMTNRIYEAHKKLQDMIFMQRTAT